MRIEFTPKELFQLRVALQERVRALVDLDPDKYPNAAEAAREYSELSDKIKSSK